MATWGYCRVCDKLVPIRPVPSGWEDGVSPSEVRFGQTKAAVYCPAPHDAEDGTPCPGSKRPV